MEDYFTKEEKEKGIDIYKKKTFEKIVLSPLSFIADPPEHIYIDFLNYCQYGCSFCFNSFLTKEPCAMSEENVEKICAHVLNLYKNYYEKYCKTNLHIHIGGNYDIFSDIKTLVYVKKLFYAFSKLRICFHMHTSSFLWYFLIQKILSDPFFIKMSYPIAIKAIMHINVYTKEEWKRIFYDEDDLLFQIIEENRRNLVIQYYPLMKENFDPKVNGFIMTHQGDTLVFPLHTWNIGQLQKPEPSFCPFLQNTMYINATGDVYTCPFGEAFEIYTYRMGNIEDYDLYTIWNSTRYQDLRSNFFSKENKPAWCKNCQLV